ncbi:MAG TPA: ABC transporter ATP-binding protein [Steroidobacteraceae bacterium]|jgi:ATP-binding cassette subfamily B protein
MRRLLWPHLRGQRLRFAGALTLALLMAGLSAAQPLLTRLAVDQGLIGRHFNTLAWACAGMLLLAATGYALGGLHRTLYIYASGRTLFSLRAAVFEHLLNVSPRRLSQEAVGDLVSRLDGDIAEVQRFGTDALLSLLSSLLSLVAVAAVMFTLSWRLALLVTLLMPLQLLVRRYARPRLEASTRAYRESAAELSGYLVEHLAGARQVQAAAAEARAVTRLEGLGERYLKRVVDQQWVSYVTASVSALLGHFATAATFLIGGWMVLSQMLSVGTLIAFVAYLGRSAGSASSVASFYSGYHRARVSLSRVQHLLCLPTVKEQADAVAIGDARGDLAFDAVTVRGPGEERLLLDGVSFDIPAGSKVVLRGVSGAGKSTIADLLRRFLDPDRGRVLLDGLPLTAYRLQELRRRIAVVEHSPILFRGSIYENLGYGCENLERDKVMEAARRAGVDEFVSSLPKGYDTPIGEGGAGLSTGQRQRIAIARAALAEPLIVVLDEATSGLDVEAARLMHRALDTTFASRTRLIITHRVSDVEQADLCWRLEAGHLKPAALA